LKVREDWTLCCTVQASKFASGAYVVLLKSAGDERHWDDQDEEEWCGLVSCQSGGLDERDLNTYSRL
jgi:hypothetical protein